MAGIKWEQTGGTGGADKFPQNKDFLLWLSAVLALKYKDILLKVSVPSWFSSAIS